MTASQLLTLTGSVNASCSKANHRRTGQVWRRLMSASGTLQTSISMLKTSAFAGKADVPNSMSDNDLGGHLSLPGPCAPWTFSEPERAALRSCG